MINILVLGISGNVSQGILKALRLSNLTCKIIGACVNTGTVGDLWCDGVYDIPYAVDVSFISCLIDICNKEEIDIVLTGVEENLLAMAEHINELKKSCKSIFVVSEYEKLKIGQDKLLTCQWLKENGFHYPVFALSENQESVQKLVAKKGFPLIAKPRHGKGSEGLRIINNEMELQDYVNLSDYVIQSYVGNKDSEYTVSCYLDRNGNSYKPIVLQRWLFNGTTWKANVIDNPRIEQECNAICQAFGPMGPLNIQLRLDESGEPVPFELNVRFSGTTPMRANFGFRDVEAVLKEYILNEPISDCFSIVFGNAYRYINEAYVWSAENDSNISVDCTLKRDLER